MKKILMAAVALTALTATPAMAETATYSVSGSVAPACSVAATGSLDFGPMINGSADLSAPDQESVDGPAYCNGAGTTVSVAHTNLTHTSVATAPTGFSRVVSFVPEVVLGGTSYEGDRTGTVVGAFAGMTVKAKNASVANGTKPLAGSYSGSITITLTPGA